MNKKLIEQWVVALRSLDYTHGTNTLRSIDDRFCPLGVLCDISKDVLGLEWQAGVRDYRISGISSMLPHSVVNYIGLDFNNALININNSKIPSEIRECFINRGGVTKVSIICLNDSFYLTNYHIADILEEEFLNEDKTANVA